MNANEKLEQIKVALRHTIELADKATQGPWQCDITLVTVASESGDRIIADCIDGNERANAAFIAHARTFAPAAAKALLTVLDGLERLSRLQHNDGELCHELETICREWPEDVK